VRQLLAAGKEVSVLDLHPLPEACCEARIGDIRDREAVRAACAGAEVVFQTAAAVWEPGTHRGVYDSINVEGNQIVVDTCRELGIQRLVYTSTIDVVVDGRAPIVDGDESLPYPEKLPGDHYSRTKIEAEQLVIAANGADLATCALRPAGMYGPRDRYHLGNVLEMARAGKYMRAGSGKARFTHVYSENAAHVHLLAAERLFPGSPVAGQVYFVGDHYPATNLFDFMEPYLEALGFAAPTRSIPYPVAYAAACVAELVAPRSNLTRFSVVQTCVDHTYRHDKAERDLDYQPIVSHEEAFRRTLEYWKAKLAE
jgi:sterol-4alpha-carboxylate 3-dehydrogenase (decarboxylating)